MTAARSHPASRALCVAMFVAVAACGTGDTPRAADAQSSDSAGEREARTDDTPKVHRDSLGISRRIGQAGGELVLAGIGRARFAPGAFREAADVEMLVTRSAETAEVFGLTSFDPSARAPWELRIHTAGAAPASGVELLLAIPAQFAGRAVAPFAQLYQSSEQDLLDGFERVPGTRIGGDMRVVLEPAAFTSARRKDGRFEAIVILVAVPGPAVPGPL